MILSKMSYAGGVGTTPPPYLSVNEQYFIETSSHMYFSIYCWYSSATFLELINFVPDNGN